jgi:hypothetical protein
MNVYPAHLFGLALGLTAGTAIIAIALTDARPTASVFSQPVPERASNHYATGAFTGH